MSATRILEVEHRVRVYHGEVHHEVANHGDVGERAHEGRVGLVADPGQQVEKVPETIAY